MKKFLILVVVILVSIGYFILSLPSDVVSFKYSDYKELKKDEIIAKGWLPNILPKSITNIEVNNNLDLNTSTGSFDLEKDDVNMFFEKLEKKDGYYSYKNWAFWIDDKSNKVKYFLNVTIKP